MATYGDIVEEGVGYLSFLLDFFDAVSVFKKRLCPLGDVPVEKLSFLPVDGGIESAKVLDGLVDCASAGGGKGDDFLVVQLGLVEEGVHDSGFDIPPDREAKEDKVVLGKVGNVLNDLGAGGFVFHFKRTAAPVVPPIEVFPCIGRFRMDGIEVGREDVGNFMGLSFRRSFGGEIGNQDFLFHISVALL